MNVRTGLGALAVSLWLAGGAHAAVFDVDTTDDTSDIAAGDGECADIHGECSLHAAVQEANALAGFDTIHIPPGIYFVTTPLVISTDMELAGTSEFGTYIDGSGVTYILLIGSGSHSSLAHDLTLKNSFYDAGNGNFAAGAVTVSPGATFALRDASVTDNVAMASGTGSGAGAGISNFGVLTLTRVRVTDNQATRGAGVFGGTAATTTILESRISGNNAVGNANDPFPCGGGIRMQNGGLIRDTVIEDNTAELSGAGCGGGIFNFTGSKPLVIERSLIRNNFAPQAAAMQNRDPGVVEMTNTTISGNQRLEGGFGGVVLNIVGGTGAATVTLNNCTITDHAADIGFILDNSGSGGLPATIRLKNTIVDNPGADACSSQGTNTSFASFDYNLLSDSTCFAASAHDLLDASANLEALADNGGPTQTNKPKTDSAAINAIPPASCRTVADAAVTTDQRGAGRPAEGACERGAFEISVCGDGLSGGDEQCDDGGTAPGDCCSATCTYEAEGSACKDQGATVCDDPDSCDGAGSCLANEKPNTTVCRPSAATCDAVESCTGTSAVCPPDSPELPGTPCGDAGESVCDHADTCDDTAKCAPNLAPDGTVCDDSDICTIDQCASGACQSAAVPKCGVVPEDEAAGNEFGSSMALSTDYLVVGAPASLNSSSGRVHVFVRVGNDYVEQTQTEPIPLPFQDPDHATGDLNFGASVDVDAQTIIVGAPFDVVPVGNGKVSHGSASIFFFNGMAWVQQAKLVDTLGLCNELGTDVAISGDTAVVGAPGSNCVNIYRRTGATWANTDGFNLSTVGARYGQAVDVSGDTILIGAPGTQSEAGCNPDGSVYLLRRNGTSWGFEDRVDEPAEAGGGACFGSGVALDRTTAVIGAPYDDSAEANAGAAYVIDRIDDTQWEITTQLLAFPDAHAGDRFGSSVDLKLDVILVGAPGIAAYLFQAEPSVETNSRFAAKWDSLRVYSPPSDSSPELSKFAFSVAVAPGATAVGAPSQDSSDLEQAGAVYPGDAVPEVTVACGDGNKTPDEDCDDGDTTWKNGQHCNALCKALACGDADDSGKIRSGDALFALRASVGLGTCDLSVCDASGNGKLAAGDALLILKKAVGLSATLMCP